MSGAQAPQTACRNADTYPESRTLSLILLGSNSITDATGLMQQNSARSPPGGDLYGTLTQGTDEWDRRKKSQSGQPHRRTRLAFLDTLLTSDTLLTRLHTMTIFVAAATEGEIIGTIACRRVSESQGHLREMAVPSRMAWKRDCPAAS